MRDYLYIWHDLKSKRIISSGIEFKDFQSHLNSRGGILLLDHQADCAEDDLASGLAFVPGSRIGELAREDVYSWGNFTWADFDSAAPPNLSDGDIAELLFFSHKGRPLNGNFIPHLNNDFLAYGHDDGWYLNLAYSKWEAVERFVGRLPSAVTDLLDLSSLRLGIDAFWIKNGIALIEEMTYDIDSVLNRRLFGLC